jgi:hypothetical protein
MTFPLKNPKKLSEQPGPPHITTHIYELSVAIANDACSSAAYDG